MSVTRLWPAPGVLALELRDLAARTVEFRVLAAADGRELFRYHDPAAPWWLALAGCTPVALRLAELDPARLGLPRGFREVPLPLPVGGASETDKATENQPPTTAASWQTPVAYAANGPHFAPLAAFIEAHTGQRPGTAIDVLETPDCTVLGYGPAVPGAAYEVLVMRPDGEVAWRTTLGESATETATETATENPEPAPAETATETAARPDGPRFCTFGPILYALGLPGEVVAWALPGA